MRSIFIALIASSLGWQVSNAGEIGVSVVFSDNEIRIIRAYYHDHVATSKHKGKQPGGLPPGIAKNLQRGKPLPPGIAKQYLPQQLLESLPRRTGYERIVLDGKILLVEIATQVIHDILTDAVLH